nr:MAG: chaperone of endosialidase [Bacteriophage sp.]
MYLRGGANYFYTSDYADLKMTAHSSEVSDGYNTYSIKDTQGDIKDFFTYVENDLFAEVKNLQIVHDNEFNFASNSIGGYVWINYRSRYDAVTSAKAVYVGNGQAGADGAYGAVHASGFFKESDIRLKSDIAPLKHTLDQICEIPTVEFNMHDKHQIGTIA